MIGFEALSRGAASVQALENDTRHIRVLSENSNRLGLTDAEYRVIAQDVTDWLQRPNPDAGYDLIFADPPYAFSAADCRPLIEACCLNDWLAPMGRLIWESADRSLPSDDLIHAELTDRRFYGTTVLSFYTHRSAAE